MNRRYDYFDQERKRTRDRQAAWPTQDTGTSPGLESGVRIPGTNAVAARTHQRRAGGLGQVAAAAGVPAAHPRVDPGAEGDDEPDDHTGHDSEHDVDNDTEHDIRETTDVETKEGHPG